MKEEIIGINKPYEIFAENPEELLGKKRQQWKEKMDEMMKPDVYGYVLDKEIRETVVALQLLGFNTTQSDQGNYSESPWVQFEAEPPRDIYEGENEIKNSIMEKLGIFASEIDERSPLFNREKQVDVEEKAREKLFSTEARYTHEFEKWHKETIILADKLDGIINEFYATHQAPEEYSDLRVNIEFPYRTSQHAQYVQDIPFLRVKTNSNKRLTEEERKQMVVRTQHEMKRFTEYLKERYYSATQ